MQNPGGFPLHAWVHERMRQKMTTAPLYLLGAVVADPSQCDGAREQLRNILPQGTMPDGLRVEIGFPQQEPMLWIPDQVLGALGDAEHAQTTWFDQYAGAVASARELRGNHLRAPCRQRRGRVSQPIRLPSLALSDAPGCSMPIDIKTSTCQYRKYLLG